MKIVFLTHLTQTLSRTDKKKILSEKWISYSTMWLHSCSKYIFKYNQTEYGLTLWLSYKWSTAFKRLFFPDDTLYR